MDQERKTADGSTIESSGDGELLQELVAYLREQPHQAA